MRLLLLAGLTAASLAAADIAGTTFPDRLAVAGQDLPLRGTALQRWKVVFKVHTTGWWQDPASAVLADVPKALELHYFHDIEAAHFRQATQDGFARGRSAADLAALAPGLATWNAAYVDIREGQRYRITYDPAHGTTLSRDGTDLVTVPGVTFMEAIFGIWLGAHPVDRGHREDLLDG